MLHVTHDWIQVWDIHFPEQHSWEERTNVALAQASKVAYVPEPSLFFTLFPFHILVDQNMKIIQASGLGARQSGLIP